MYSWYKETVFLVKTVLQLLKRAYTSNKVIMKNINVLLCF